MIGCEAAKRLAHRVAQGLRRLERRDRRGGDLDGFPRAGIATGSRRTLLDREGAETGNGNRFVPGESVADGGEYGTDQAVGRGLRQR